MTIRAFCWGLSGLGVTVFLSQCKTFESSPKKNSNPVTAAPQQAIDPHAIRGFLTATDTAVPAKVNPIAPDQMSARINARGGVIYNSNPAGTTAKSSCDRELAAAARVVATATDATVDYSKADVRDCALRDMGPSAAGTQVTRASVRTLLRMNCTGADLSALNGMTLQDVWDKHVNESFCGAGTESNYILNTDVSFAASMTVSGVTASWEGRTIQARMAADGSACRAVKVGTVWKYSDCRLVEISSISNVQGPVLVVAALQNQLGADYLLAEFINIVAEIGKPYFTSGSLNLAINDWRGRVDYSGPTVAPTWQSASGSPSGVFRPTGLMLRSGPGSKSSWQQVADTVRKALKK